MKSSSLENNKCFYCGNENDNTLSVVINTHFSNQQANVEIIKSKEVVSSYTKIQGSICKPCYKNKKIELLKDSVKFFLLLLIINPIVSTIIIFNVQNQVAALAVSVILIVLPFYFAYSKFFYGKYDLFTYDLIINEGGVEELLMYPRYAVIDNKAFQKYNFENINELKFIEITEP